jgi:hypothetical protein
MVPQLNPNNQQESLKRQQKREIERQHKKAYKKLQKLTEYTNLPVVFNNHTVTSYGNFSLIESFKQAVGFIDLLQKHLTVNRHHNFRYSTAQLVDIMTDCICVGLFRFMHMDALKSDPGYCKIKGIEKVPDESTFRQLLARFEQENISQLQQINQSLLALKANIEGCREVWLDIDDTVITLFGNQEGGEVGYNPRYHGRPSYKAKVAFVSESAELANIRLYGGKTASNGQFAEFFKEMLALLPQMLIVKGVRMDKGFFDDKNFTFFEDNQIEYVCKVPLKQSIYKIIAYLDEQKAWQRLDAKYDTAEITVPLPTWKKARRFVFIRETIELKSNEPCLFYPDLYDYEVIVTNMEDLPPEEVWRWYNKRCNVENKIDELKQGLAVDQTSQHEMIRNAAFIWIKALAYNLLNWFKSALMPQEHRHHEVPTLRRVLINIPGNIVGSDRYRHIRLAPNAWLEKTITIIKENFKVFLKKRAWLMVYVT